jgi:hypothetical protein
LERNIEARVKELNDALIRLEDWMAENDNFYGEFIKK